MSSKEIRRNRVPCYNNTSQLIIAEREFNVRWPILENPKEYTAVVESASIDLGQAVLDPEPEYKIMIFCDLKTGLPPGFVTGANYFAFKDPLIHVDQFTKWLQDTLLKAPQPYNLGLFELDSQDFLTYSLQESDYQASFVSGDFKVYFNSQLVPIMDGFVDKYSAPTEANGELYYAMTPVSGTRSSTTDTIYRLNKIESFQFITTLPITGTEVLDLKLNDAIVRKVLGTIEMNSLTYNLRAKSDWKYSPNVLRHYTMNQTASIQAYTISVLIQYNNGRTAALKLNPGERFVINLAFYPRDSVLV